jgi:hypothetical protein
LALLLIECSMLHFSAGMNCAASWCHLFIYSLGCFFRLTSYSNSPSPHSVRPRLARGYLRGLLLYIKRAWDDLIPLERMQVFNKANHVKELQNQEKPMRMMIYHLLIPRSLALAQKNTYIYRHNVLRNNNQFLNRWSLLQKTSSFFPFNTMTIEESTYHFSWIKQMFYKLT